MTILHIEHPIQEFTAWKAAFDSDPIGRERSGVRRYRIARPVDNPHYVVVELDFDSASHAEAVLAMLHELWGRVGPTGLIGGPQARILDVVETIEY